ncbi:hypothetical protein H0H87_011129 [Tephrocybe sp. NHM501043]|nr:hypothetical protein H0H87_011129 [Tephrocybe sp. NHM501043]
MVSTCGGQGALLHDTPMSQRWPKKQVVAKTMNKRQEDLAEAKLKEEELRKKVKVNGVEMYSHVAWADRVEHLAKAIPDNDNLLVYGTRNNMLAPLKALVLMSANTWSVFCTAVRAVDIMELKEKCKERERTRKLEEEVQQLHNTWNPPVTPSKVLAAVLGRVQLGLPIPPPVFGQPRATNTTANTQTQGSQVQGSMDTGKAVNTPPTAVHIINTFEDLPADIMHEQLHAWVDAYLLERDGQEKEEGSST